MSNSSKSVLPQLMKADEVAQMVAISTRTIWRLVSADKFPSPIHLGGSTRWRRSDIEAWIAAGCRGQANDQQ